ncbi:transposable element Tcb2 transposase [Trichonephila clavipes]|nr:transposable element Tcb2 transposase [Trichonephila clavipes]
MSASSILRRLLHRKLPARVLLYRIPLTANHRWLRLQWAHEHKAWQADWHQAVFSDKSRFNLWDHGGRIRVGTYAGEHCLPECVYRMAVWPNTRSYGLGCDFVSWKIQFSYVLRQDNTRPHVAKSVRDFCSAQHMQLLPWPAYSLDMSPIEHVWDLVDQRLARDPRPAASKDEPLLRMQAIWNSLPQADIQNLFDSIPRSIRILFSDEAHFWLNGYVNKQNCRIWSEANPQVYVETPLHPEKLTAWGALWAGGINGPYFFKNDDHNVTVNGDRYRALITNFFIPELNNQDVQELWFQQDGATCHTARATIDLLKNTFGDRLISRFGPVNWPPRSCDLTPLDYFMWGYVKSLDYADKPQTLDHLEDNIRRVIADIRPQILEKVIENWTSRLDYSSRKVGVLDHEALRCLRSPPPRTSSLRPLHLFPRFSPIQPFRRFPPSTPSNRSLQFRPSSSVTLYTPFSLLFSLSGILHKQSK